MRHPPDRSATCARAAWLRTAGLASLLLLPGCGGDSAANPSDLGPPRADGASDWDGAGEGEGEGAAVTDGWPPPDQLRWQEHRVEIPGEIGGLRLAASATGVALAYLLGTDATEPCELGSAPVPLRRWEVRYRPAAASSEDESLVATTNVAYGLDLAFHGAGTAYVAFQGGGPARQFCGSSDMVLAEGPPWQVRTIQADSGTGATCSKGQDVCNTGDVTGLWPTLAVRGDQQLLAFQDIHFGFTKEDWDSADLEIARGPAWQVTTADDSRGAGVHASAALAWDGTPAVAFFLPTLGGLWLTQPAEAAWAAVRIEARSTATPLSLAARPDGRFGLAFQDAADQVLFLTEQGGPDSPWTLTPVDERATTGLRPQLRYTSTGRAVIAYRQCHRQPRQAACAAEYDGVWLAVRGTRGTWERLELSNDPLALDGEWLALALQGAGGLPVVAFTRSRPDPVEPIIQRELVVRTGVAP